MKGRHAHRPRLVPGSKRQAPEPPGGRACILGLFEPHRYSLRASINVSEITRHTEERGHVRGDREKQIRTEPQGDGARGSEPLYPLCLRR